MLLTFSGVAYYCVCQDKVIATSGTSYTGVDGDCMKICGKKALRKNICKVGANGERTFAVMKAIHRSCCAECGHKASGEDKRGILV